MREELEVCVYSSKAYSSYTLDGLIEPSIIWSNVSERVIELSIRPSVAAGHTIDCSIRPPVAAGYMIEQPIERYSRSG